MMLNRIEKIVYNFPINYLDSIKQFAILGRIFESSKNYKKDNTQVLLSTLSHKSSPVTEFKLVHQSHSSIQFILSDESIAYEFGENIFINEKSNNKEHLGLEEFFKILTPKLGQVDHTGILISKNRLDENTWKNLIGKLGCQSNLYSYPTGEDWPFLLPATEIEFSTEIIDFSQKRLPKFELVYVKERCPVTIQIDMETQFTKSELENLLPEPLGFCFTGLGQYFRSVYVNTSWPGFILRFDLRYKEEGSVHSWNSGQWLVEEGLRLK
ncbi:MAG: hypothetical protein HON90_07745 [Halobacteriovoraceae bacterium]|jgi:hypothetical protein|nr:hypothetical protein [Halobacteriovoraceae bacterium]